MGKGVLGTMGTLRSRASRPVLTYARLGKYGVVHHVVSDVWRTTPGHDPRRTTVCGRVISEYDYRGRETPDAPPWPLCAACARVMAS